ncbi:SDR family oxidoreductase [Halochromatium salexigens]|uniref:Short-chain dehydrogenase n=1 Tax=Halochromatium salexigens TaxID=49447 RepID=A0AAJ0UE17_HALSE|nr:SDR family oxidoreductase [Halochromatium salexigens]MBK5929646.1 short-chain dehydrogenase [Halochromatium salexigens]
MPDQPVAIVTGAYRGLGYETCRQLAQQGYRVVLGARRGAEGQAAVDALVQEGLTVSFDLLDVTDETSRLGLRDRIQQEFGRLDVLVNNAGIFPDPAPGDPQSSILQADLEPMRRAFETNTLAALRLCQLLIPLMNSEGRIVNIASGMGQLSDMNGFCPAYRLSKTALNAVTRIFADELGADSGIKINSVCPGWVRTEMGGSNAHLSIEEGVKGILWAATLPADGPSGGFFRHGEPIPW